LYAIIPAALATALGACGEQRSTSAPAAPQAATSAAASGPAAPSANAAPNPSSASAASSSKADAGPPPYDGPYAGATVLQAPVYSEMEPPASEAKEGKRSGERSVRLGYLRRGGKAPVIPEPHKKSNCTEGWYELVAGGFVCGRYVTLDLNHPRFRLARTPDLQASLPYTYGVNNAHGTPLYRQVPSREERTKIEPWLTSVHKKPDGTSAPPQVSIAGQRPRRGRNQEPGDDDNPSSSPAPAATPSSSTAAPAASDAAPQIGESAGDAQAQAQDRPWYMRDPDAGTPPQVTLDELKGEEGGLLARRMVKGFYLSLDRSFGSNGSMWWKTNDGLIAPADRIWVAKPLTEFHGVWLGQETGTFITHAGGTSHKIDKLPIAFITSRTPHKWLMADSKKHASSGGALDRFATVALTGETVTINGTEFWETDEGWWVRSIDGTKAEPGPAPEKLGADEKWIDVNLTRQTLVAFVGDKPVFATIVSSGRAGHETPPGSFRIREKHIASTMDGDADTATDGPYSIEDVPYIEYFNAGYALHGAFWHTEFGHVKSHGCVNLAPWDAKAVFVWTDPQLPEGWHGVNATKEHPGTRVVLHE
jgi:hypothetical protein